METYRNRKVVSAKSRKEWRKWLEKNHQTESSVWLIIFHKCSEVKSVYYDEAVEEAICFGWIDSIANKRDSESKYQLFSRRKPGSKWSRLNRQRSAKMISQGMMTPAGQALIDRAMKEGTWEALEQVQSAVIPDDLRKLFNKNKTALKNFQAFPPSSKRIILEWILNARQPQTRERRIAQTVELAAKNIKANHYRQ